MYLCRAGGALCRAGTGQQLSALIYRALTLCQALILPVTELGPLVQVSRHSQEMEESGLELGALPLQAPTPYFALCHPLALLPVCSMMLRRLPMLGPAQWGARGREGP